MLNWLDIAYAILDVFIIFRCFKNYFSYRRKLFLSFGLGFIFLTISDFLWVFTTIPLISSIIALYSYIRLVFYALFILLILQAFRYLESKSAQTKADDKKCILED
jgi:hypothetical protein